jgi:hypothetical protein
MAIAIKQSSVSILASILLCFLFMLSCVTFWYQSTIITDAFIVSDVKILASLFKKINEQCTILDFKFQSNNQIDFMQVISFEGSELGSMLLQYPQRWRRPYLRDNFTAQGKFYQIVKTKDGFFILPGDGVILHNGKIIGKDIPHNFNDDIPALLNNPRMLQFQGKPLGAHIELKKT